MNVISAPILYFLSGVLATLLSVWFGAKLTSQARDQEPITFPFLPRKQPKIPDDPYVEGIMGSDDQDEQFGSEENTVGSSDEEPLPDGWVFEPDNTGDENSD